MKYRYLFLLVGLSLNVSAQTKFNYGGPFTVDALKSNEGLVEMVVPRETPISIVFKGCDYAKSTHEDSNMLVAGRYSGGRSVIIKNDFTESTRGVYPVNINTNEGLMHTIVLVPAPKDYSLSKINLKLVIESTFECSHS